MASSAGLKKERQGRTELEKEKKLEKVWGFTYSTTEQRNIKNVKGGGVKGGKFQQTESNTKQNLSSHILDVK
jgi:hypothetical protein